MTLRLSDYRGHFFYYCCQQSAPTDAYASPKHVKEAGAKVHGIRADMK